MYNLKEIRDRINSVSSIMKMTNAMELVAASKLKKTKYLLNNIIKYNNIINNIYQKIASIVNYKILYKYNNIYKLNHLINNHKNNKILLIIITSNKGLCGSYNTSILKKLNIIIKYYINHNISFLTIGKIGKLILSKKYTIYKDYSNIFDYINNNLEYIYMIINNIINIILYQQKFTLIKIVYYKYITNLYQQVIVQQIFPIKLIPINFDDNKNYIIEPSKEELFISLFHQILHNNIFKAIIESFMCENILRMMTMHKATNNALELKNELQLTYNKIRQSIITNEILEVINGSKLN